MIAIPAAAVAAGYLAAMHALGFSPSYLRMVLGLAGGILAVWVVRRSFARKPNSTGE